MEGELIFLNSQDATHRLLLLHGWGADGEDLMPLGRELIANVETKIDLIALRAPENHPQGLGRQWYSLFPPDWASVPEAIHKLQGRIRNLPSLEKIPLEKTILLGFSQGAAMALSVGQNLPLAGMVICSGYAHPGWIAAHNRVPIFLSHGSQDEVVPVEACDQIFNQLKKEGLNVELEKFEGGHEIPNKTLLKIQLFIKKCLN